MLRALEPADVAPLIALATRTGVFKPLELIALGEVLDDYLAGRSGDRHRASVLCEGKQCLGFAYWAEASMTERSWYLYWIAVEPAEHNKGYGRLLLGEVETDVRRESGRLLWIETSSLPNYQATRRFYQAAGYAVAATLEDFYAPGDSMVVFRKAMAAGEVRP